VVIVITENLDRLSRDQKDILFISKREGRAEALLAAQLRQVTVGAIILQVLRATTLPLPYQSCKILGGYLLGRCFAMPISTGSTIDVVDWINRQKIGRLQMIVFFLSGACALVEGFDAQNIGFVAPVLVQHWALSPPEFAPAFMAGLIGLLLGCLIIAPFADRFGRKSVMLGSVLAFAFFSLLTMASSSLLSLGIFRFFTGLGVGGGMANAIALTSEYFPERKRASMTAIMFVGFPLGGSLGGFLSAWLIPRFGWQSVFFVGGVIPIIIGATIALVLPESIRHLVVHQIDGRRVAAILRRINPDAAFAEGARFVITEEHKKGLPVAHLFREGRTLGTILIWIVFFMSLLVIYLIFSWLPILLNDAGLSISLSIVILAVLQLSGVVACGGIGPVLEHRSLFVVLLPAYLVAAIGIAAIGASSSVAFVMVAAALAGIGIICGQNTVNALAAAYYPTYIRATGVGWALGIGRIGAIVGPAVGGVMLALHLSGRTLFLLSAIPELIAFAALLVLVRLGSVRTAAAPREPLSAIGVGGTAYRQTHT
jgi:MFS transporter, AAHS family, 4-hydroxybenzoate transporter